MQRAGNTVHVNVQLIRAATDEHLWAESYTRTVDDVFAVQVEVAKTIATQLQAELSPNEQSAIERRSTSNLSAFDAYSRARTLVATSFYSLAEEKNMLQAVDYLNDAVARDPSFFEAYCELAAVHDRLYAGHDRSESHPGTTRAGRVRFTECRPLATGRARNAPGPRLAPLLRPA